MGDKGKNHRIAQAEEQNSHRSERGTRAWMSTGSQYLHELCRLGRISETNLSMSKKWKYYEVNRAVASPIEEQNRLAFQDNRLLWAVIATVLVLGALFLVYSSKPGITTQSVGGSRTAGQALSPPSNIPVKNGTTVFSISDSPQSYDISGVYVNISNVSVRNAATGNFSCCRSLPAGLISWRWQTSHRSWQT